MRPQSPTLMMTPEQRKKIQLARARKIVRKKGRDVVPRSNRSSCNGLTMVRGCCRWPRMSPWALSKPSGVFSQSRPRGTSGVVNPSDLSWTHMVFLPQKPGLLGFRPPQLPLPHPPGPRKSKDCLPWHLNVFPRIRLETKVPSPQAPRVLPPLHFLWGTRCLVSE